MRPPALTELERYDYKVWYSFVNKQTSPGGEILAQATADKDSPWFAGHFPGDPILPGIAQLAMVSDLLAEMAGNNVSIQSISRVKFRKIIRPGDLLDIQATLDNNKALYTFRITSDGDIVCSGMIHFETKNTTKVDTAT